MENKIIIHEDFAIVYLNGKELKIKIYEDELVISETSGEFISISPRSPNKIAIY